MYEIVTNCLDCGAALERQCSRYCPWCLRLRTADFWRRWEDEIETRRWLQRMVMWRDLAA